MSRRIIFFLPVFIGIGALFWVLRAPTDTTTEVHEERLTVVRVTDVVGRSLAPRAVGYGTVTADRSWQAVVQVSGVVTSLASGLGVGSVVEAGADLIVIEPRDYEIRRTKALANIESALAQMDEIARSEVNLRQVHALEARIQESYRADVARKEKLRKSGAGAQSSLDQAVRVELTQQRKVQELAYQLSLLPVQRRNLDALLINRRADLEEAERALSNTRITVPFRARVVQSNIELGQYVRAGEVLVKLDGVGAAEIVAEFQLRDVMALFQTLDTERLSRLVRQHNDGTVNRLVENLTLNAHVHQDIAGVQHTWDAGITRFRPTSDSITRTMGIVVRVENANLPDPAHSRPPLNHGTFVRVEVSSDTKPVQIAIPRTGLRRSDQGKPYVYLVDASNRLELREIVPGFVLGDNILIESGLSEGDVLVLSDPVPAVSGMLLKTMRDVEPVSPKANQATEP